MFEASKITPENFGEYIAKLIAEKVPQILEKVTPKIFEVLRQTPTGPTKQQMSLPQALAELTDQLRMNAELEKYRIAVEQQLIIEEQKLIIELQENRKIGAEALKRHKRHKRHYDDDEED